MKLKITAEIIVDVDGERPSDAQLHDSFADGVPGVLFPLRPLKQDWAAIVETIETKIEELKP